MFGALLSAGASIAGSLLGRSSAKATNAANAAAAEQANEFTKEQMQNRHQWEVSDLKAAGLNPVLSAGGTPSIGSSAKADVINPMDSISQGANSAMAAQRLGAELDRMRAETANLNADEKLKYANAKAAEAMAKNQNMLAGLAGAQTQGVISDNNKKAVIGDVYQSIADPVQGALSSAKSVHKNFKDSFTKNGWLGNPKKFIKGIANTYHKKFFKN